jgi:hypothetical protein
VSRAALVCIRPTRNHYDPSGRVLVIDSSELTFWASADEALDAERTLGTPRCGPRCAGHHTIVFESGGRVRAVRGYNEPDPPGLACEFAQLYPRPEANLPVERWPLDPELNGPLGSGDRRSSFLAERINHGHGVALAQGVAVVPENVSVAAP